MLKWDDVKVCVQMRFINKERNSHFLKNLSCKDILNLTVVFFVEIVAKDRESNYIMIDKNIQKELQQNVDGLFKQALENMSMKDMCLLSLSEAADVSQEYVEDMGAYVLTNRTKMFGATLILLKEVREKIHSFFGESVYVLPSSTHELILAPVSKMCCSSEELYKMVLEVNQTLHPMDVLADSLYMLELDGTLSIVHGGTA